MQRERLLDRCRGRGYWIGGCPAYRLGRSKNPLAPAEADERGRVTLGWDRKGKAGTWKRGEPGTGFCSRAGKGVETLLCCVWAEERSMEPLPFGAQRRGAAVGGSGTLLCTVSSIWLVAASSLLGWYRECGRGSRVLGIRDDWGQPRLFSAWIGSSWGRIRHWTHFFVSEQLF